jgi:ABC-type Na+ efflux pump permease subunit
MMPVLLIAEREFRTYVATLSFWLSLAVAPLAAGVAVLLSGGPSQPLPVSILGGDAALSRSAHAAVEEAGRLEGHVFVFGAQGSALVLSQRAPQTLDVTFGDGFPLSPVGRAMVAHVIERDMARSEADKQASHKALGVFSVSVAQEETGHAGIDAGRLSRLFTMAMLWLTLTGSLGMLLQAIVRERANRALESLLAAARGWEIVTGKLAGVGAVSLLILTVWLGSAALFSLFLPPEAGLVGAVLAQFAQPLTLLHDALIYLCAFGFYGAATLVLGAMARDSASAQNVARPLFLMLLGAFFFALAAPAEAFSWATWLPPLTPFVLLVNSPGTVAALSQAILMGLMILATVALMLLAARLLAVGSGADKIFRPKTPPVQPVV